MSVDTQISKAYFPELQCENLDELNMSQRAYVMLKSAIINNELPMDVPISQVKLAEQFGISRTPLREAINKLEQECLIKNETNKRIVIPKYTAEDIDQLLAMRITLECLAVRISALMMTEQDLDELEEIFHRMQAAESQNPTIFSDIHREFHRKLCSKVGFHLKTEIEKMSQQAVRYQIILLGAAPVDLKTHEKLLQACRARDPKKISYELAVHYGNVAVTVLNEFDPTYEPVAVRQALRINTV